MNMIDALHTPWAIRPEMLQTMLDIFERHARGEGFNREAIEAAIGKPLNNQAKPYQVVDGVAVLNLVGVLGKRMSLFADISGGASTQLLQKELATALADPTAHSILLYIDSPGGEIDGTQALANDVYNARGVKPIVALGDGQIASAAYWIGSAADRVYITDDTTLVGSIGVVATHTDVSRAQEMRGVKTTEITAGKYKRIASNYAPLSAEGKQSLQDLVDHPYSVMVNDIARNRGTDAETVLKDMADGRIFQGQQAIDAGLVDDFATLNDLVSMLAQQTISPVIGATPTTPGGAMQPRETINARHHDAHNSEPPAKEIAAKAQELIGKEEAAGRYMTAEAAVRQIRSTLGLPKDPAPITPTIADSDNGASQEARVAAHTKTLAERTQRLIAEAKHIGIDLDFFEACKQARKELGDAPRD